MGIVYIVDRDFNAFFFVIYVLYCRSFIVYNLQFAFFTNLIYPAKLFSCSFTHSIIVISLFDLLMKQTNFINLILCCHLLP